MRVGQRKDILKVLQQSRAAFCSQSKSKALPYLKNSNHNLQHIDYSLYERLRRNRKLQLIKPNQDSNLFLEGEFVSAARPPPLPKNQPSKNKETILQLIGRPKESKCKKVYKIFIEQQQPTSQNSEQLPSSILKPFKKKFSSTLNTLQHRPSPSSVKKKTISAQHTPNKTSQPLKLVKKSQEKRNDSTNCLVRPIETSRPLFYFDKKESTKIKSQLYVVVEYPSMQVLVGNRHKSTSQIASLTKIMTFFTAFKLAQEHGIDIGKEMVCVDEEAGSITGTSADLICGDELSVFQLFYGLMLPSGNDAAIALAKWGGKLIAPEDDNPMAVFIQKMNKNAKLLGLTQTSFGNPHGLPHPRGISSPYDQAVLVSYCINIPLFNQVVGTEVRRKWVVNQGVKRELIWQNTNKLLRRSGFVGTKTGVTATAGPCLASCFKHGERTFIVVILKTSKLSRRFKDTRLALGWALRRHDPQALGLAARQILREDIALDSDNSEDEQQFNYDRSDAEQFKKRNRILVYEL